MGHLEVDPTVLDDAARGLRRCVDVAREFGDRRGHLRELVEDCGSGHLSAAAEHFIGRWGYGMSLVVGDAEHLAKQVEHSAQRYRQVEAEITRAAQ